ncbi:hypothetical protein FA15DRAFT_700565 [Coprinopsis marcescibilis]|uniref:PH-domain-containing protein n=1 Tax=Coprinopsis marcescibilis TaxID=230819 RepID=A0A5C3L8B3_COPMA|nr:hypothetical protein FA15DRAFT_700565 [Coprinopsis marcescibilis]
MPDYVYALHDFQPEHEDELDFHAGERIEIVERDDLYGDGWWQGRNAAGKEGLFPQSYTTPGPPPANGNGNHAGASAAQTSTVLSALAEESENESPITKPTILSPVPQQPPASFLNGNDSDQESIIGPDLNSNSNNDTENIHVNPGVAADEDDSGAAGADGEMMKATMTDVQKAIEQLGRNRVDNDGDGGRSFSFASTRDGGETDDTDFDMSDVDAEGETQGEDWHKSARRKLAEKARAAIKDAETLEAMIQERSTAPPIDVELSDESEDEMDHDFTSRSTNFARAHPHIPEEDEEESGQQQKGHARDVASQSSALTSNTSIPSQTASTPRRDELLDVTTATKESFPVVFAPPIDKALTADVTPAPVDQSKRSSAPTPVSSAGQPLSTLPSPSGSTHASGFGVTPPFQAPSISTSATSVAESTSEDKKDKKGANEWTVDEVVDWLKSKGFDQDVCDKFTEQEITGDVLLELDVNVLKTEIGIAAFGKRMRIANAITELRRPPSIRSFEQAHTPSSVIHHPLIHSRTQSQSYSVHSYPGTPLYASHSTQGSIVPSPIQYSAPSGPLSAPSEAQSISTALASSTAVGLGIAAMESSENTAALRGGRPAHLMLSPSDGNLKSKVIIEKDTHGREDDDRAHMSDGEAVNASTSVRRRLFGRSQDSTMSIGNVSRSSKDGASPGFSPPQKEEKDLGSNGTAAAASTTGVGPRHKSKRSVDGKSSERMSIFGNAFGGSLGKGRKPPPSASEDTGDAKSSSTSSMFSRLNPSSVRKSSSNSHRPSTPSGSPKGLEKGRNGAGAPAHGHGHPHLTGAVSASAIPELNKEAFEQSVDKPVGERAMLRKRTMSGPPNGAGGAVTSSDPSGPIKQGLSILDQVGDPDHTGWMRKKGVRYNSWKLRYCVLKGEHLYILRSNNKSETRLKGYVNIHGYKVTVDENLGPGRYGFRIDHDQDKTHYFSSDEKTVIREWMKAIMKATIGRDYTRPVVSSCNIPTIPLVVAQAMNPAPRPPSPGARDATQKALRRENPHQLSSRDARVLMGLPGSGEGNDRDRRNVNSFFSEDGYGNGVATSPVSATTPRTMVPPRPSREMRRANSTRSAVLPVDENLVDWANSHLPESLLVHDPAGPLFSGLALLRIAESIKGKPVSPPVPDSAFPTGPSDDKLDGLFKLFDFLLDNDVKMGSVSINDVRQGKRDKILQLLKALKAWEDKRRALAMSVGTSVSAGGFMIPTGLY